MPLAYIALGANLPSPAGPPETTLAHAVVRLGTLGRITTRSSLYSTAPVGFADQPRFLNAVVSLETNLSPDNLLHDLLAIERHYGRNRSLATPNGPRTLDLDILLIGDLILSEFDLQVPHPHLAERAFVLVPLNEIAPQLHDPRSGLTIAQLLQNLAPGSDPAAPAVVRVESTLWSQNPEP